MTGYADRAGRDAIEAECAWRARDVPATLRAALAEAARRHGPRPAVSFQLLSTPGSRAETLSWAALESRAIRVANLLRHLGIGEGDTVALVLPNATETVVALLAGAIAGVVNPINPLLEPEQIAGILRETDARVVITLAPFPKTEIAEKVARAVHFAPRVHTVLTVDLARHLDAPRRWLVPLLRPRRPGFAHVEVLDFNRASLAHEATGYAFADSPDDRVAAYFHTGGTTGHPKIARHRYSGMIYNGWLGRRLLFSPDDTVLCPLPLFHVFAVYPILMSMIAAGAHVVLPTPAGFRGEGVFDNFWKLVERWRASYLVGVPTAFAALMQRPVDADVSTLRFAFSGSAPMPVELYRRFEAATGVTICEGYGLTEATCLVAVNPPEGEKKIGSVGLPFPYTDVRILRRPPDGAAGGECATGEVGEICVANPGVIPGSTYTEEAKNLGLYAEGRYLRTGDLGRIDEDGYLWITGRAKDLIIRGGHNIDPAEIEEALLSHPEVAFAGAVGQPDAFAGELPCAYVELVAGAGVTVEALAGHAERHVHERAAIPKHVEIMDELPKTAVGKVYKPDLRKRAIARVFDAALAAAEVAAHVAEVVDDRHRGLTARIAAHPGVSDDEIGHVLGRFARPWERA